MDADSQNRSIWATVLALGVAPVFLAACGGSSGSSQPDYQPRTRTYFAAAERSSGTTPPQGLNVMMGEPFTEEENVFVEPGPERIGRKYIKWVYREYTDETFTVLKPVAPEWEHLGILGPVLRGVVGDTMRVVFRNQTRFPATVHPHGGFYNKDSEGVPYDDATGPADKAAAAVPPGGDHTYLWQVSEQAAPAAGDGSSVVWLYHSHVDEPAHTNAGLVGTIIVTAASMANEDATPKDVDREFVTLFTVVNENESSYLADNVATYLGTARRRSCPRTRATSKRAT